MKGNKHSRHTCNIPPTSIHINLKRHDCVKAILFQTNMLESGQNNASQISQTGAWRSSRERGKSQNNGLVTCALFFLLLSSRDWRKMPRSPRGDHKALDSPTNRPQNFSRAQSERESGIFALGCTTGTGNGKQRTLRKSTKWSTWYAVLLNTW